MRKNFKAFSRGSLEFLYPDNPKVLSFMRQHEDETVLVVVNLSRFSQAAEIDLSRFAGSRLMEVFSQNYFPVIKESPYPITLGPHAHYWFVLRAQPAAVRASQERIVPTLTAAPNLQTLLSDGQRSRFEREVLPDFIRHCRWFGGKARTIRELRIAEQVPLPGEVGGQIWFLEVAYTDGAPETYALPVQIALGESAHAIAQATPQAVIARFAGTEETILHDAIWDADFREELFRTITQRKSLKGKSGELFGVSGSSLALEDNVPPSQVVAAEQSNSSMLFENKFFLKLYRKLEDGVNPDVEITRFLTERRGFGHVPAFAGAIEYRRGKSEPTVVCLLQAAVANEGDAWALTLDSVGRYYERVLGRKADLQIENTPPGPLLEELIGGIYPQKARLLGQRTGELHLALASDSDDRAFAPEPFNALSQRSVYQNMRASLRRAFALLQKKLPELPEVFRAEATEVLAAEQKILAQEQRILDHSSAATKIRIHGDYHLGQALYTGKDFIILDFEGEPARPLSERKLKRSALRDVAGMMRSFQYGAYSALWQPAMRPEDIPFLERWADLWYRQMSSVFLQSYLKTTRGASFVPSREADLQVLLEAYLLDKAVYEVGYELNNRPSWVVIPIRGIKHILAAM
jgi:maltose alpha-D-glucosyltransferase/alpha-amylase